MLHLQRYTKHIMRLAFVCALAVMGCSGNTQTQKAANTYHDQLQKAVHAPIVSVEEASYLGAMPVEYSRDYTKYPIFSAQGSLHMRGTLQEVAQTLGHMLDISVQVEPDAQDTSSANTSSNTHTVAVHMVNFEGKMLALLDHLSTLYGAAWEYDNKTNTVVFSRMQVRTFAIMAAAGALKHSTQMSSSSSSGNDSGGSGSSPSNASSSSSSSSGSSSGGSDATSDTSQSLDTDYAVDVWADMGKGIKALLSPAGSVTINRSAGSVTVRDNVPAMRQVASYIDEMNKTMQRQVALSVKVWSIDINDDVDIGMNLSLLFSENFTLATGATALTGLGVGSLTATIVEGTLKDTTATLKALNTLGRATQVTSGSGVIMNNQPLPVQNVKRQAYLGSVSSYTPSTGGNSTALKPAQVTYGFAMTVIPNILDQRRCVLQYNVGLSSLDKLEEVRSGNNNIQLPTVSMRSFNQRAFMNMGQTLVLAGFEQERESNDTSAGIFSIGYRKGTNKSLMVITITVQSMNNS